MKSLMITASMLGLMLGSAAGHEGAHVRSTSRSQTKGVKSKVEIKVEGDKRIVISNGIPKHKTGTFPNRNNPNRVSEQSYRLVMPLKPKVGTELHSANGWLFGVALNGVVFDPATAETWKGDRSWNYEALTSDLNLGLDENHAHVQPTGAYHYHGMPTGLLKELKATKDKMTLVAWAADGFPIYALYGHEKADDATSKVKKLKSSYRLKTEEREGGPGGKPDGNFTADFEYVEGLGDLDECNGRTGVTPEFPEGTYYYVLTEEFPFVPRYFKGEPDQSFNHHGGGGRGRGRGRDDERRGPGGEGEDRRRPRGERDDRPEHPPHGHRPPHGPPPHPPR